MQEYLKAEPLPIISVTLEQLSPGGERHVIARCGGFDEAEAALEAWLPSHVSAFPGGVVPFSVTVAFPRRLSFSYDFLSDAFGLMAGEALVCDGRPSTNQSGTSFLMRERLGFSMREAVTSTDSSVEAVKSRRVAGIVLPFGDPGPLGH